MNQSINYESQGKFAFSHFINSDRLSLIKLLACLRKNSMNGSNNCLDDFFTWFP